MLPLFRLAARSTVAAVLFAPALALAQENTAQPVWSAPPREAPLDAARTDTEGTRFRPLALTINPLTLMFGRFGANVEFLPAEHHAIMLNPYYSSASIELGEVRTSYRSLGAELGYHFYTGSKGANGFFVGPSFLMMRTELEAQCMNVGCDLDPEATVSTYGVALDLGGQHVFDNGITLGAGAGLMYLKSSARADGDTVLKFEGVLPRILFTVGYSI
jgi:hypothetical protein